MVRKMGGWKILHLFFPSNNDVLWECSNHLFSQFTYTQINENRTQILLCSVILTSKQCIFLHVISTEVYEEWCSSNLFCNHSDLYQQKHSVIIYKDINIKTDYNGIQGLTFKYNFNLHICTLNTAFVVVPTYFNFSLKN